MVKWTEQQQQAISLRNTDILVSAAAGSGKTATLIERIISILSDDELGTECENLLVTTFTNAAAGEIKERVRKALKEKILQIPENEHLKKQYRNISRATISTLHSFCSEVIRNNANLINIDPNFSVVDETIADNYLEDAITSVYKNKLQNKEENFLRLLSTLGYGKNLDTLSSLIISILKTVKSYPDYEQWLTKKTEESVIKDKLIFNSKYGVEIKKHILRKLNSCEIYINKISSILSGTVEYCHYEDMLNQDFDIIKNIYNFIETLNWDGLKEYFYDLKYISLPRKKKDFNEEYVDAIKEYRKAFKNSITDITSQIYDDTENIKKDCEIMYPILKEFTDTLLCVDKAYTEKKSKAKVIDYSDMEHMALKCLKSGAYELYRDKFRHILIDEYQDFNYIQEEIINQIRREGNVFAVGDLKQSIYRFRNAQTAIFKNKAVEYAKSSEKGMKLNLSYNFRSRNTILEYVNSIFSNIMNDNLGEVEYSEEEKLRYGNYNFDKDSSEDIYLPKILKYEYSKDLYNEFPTMTEIEVEAFVIVQEIKQLINSGITIFDSNKKDTRAIRYSDIVILLRSVNPYAKKYCEILNKCGILAYSDQSVEYMNDKSISDVYALLNVTDNPYQDIYLAQVMKNKVYAFNEKEITKIKKSRYGLYNDLINYKENKLLENNELLECKIKRLIDDLTAIRNFAKVNTLEKILFYAMTKSGFYYVSENQELLKRLYALAVECHKKGINDVSGFLNFIKSKKKKDKDIISEILKTQSLDSVNVMSIHKSKGLEFPVVILAGCSRKFNIEETKNRLLIDRDLGFGIEYISDINKTYHKHITKNALSLSIKRQNLSEEMRILYVALTRAKEKLIMVGKEPDKKDVLIVDDAKNYFDWILPNSDNSIQNIIKASEFSSVISSYISESKKQIKKEENFDKTAYFQDIMARLGYEYPYIEETTLNRKVSVTELAKYKSKNYDIEEFYNQYKTTIKKRPEFLNKSGSKQNAAEKGTMMHKIMASIELKKLNERKYVDFIRLKINDEEIFEYIKAFISSPVYTIICQADKVFKERVFFMPVNTSYISLITGQTYEKEHSILLQGVIDCLCIKDNHAVIIDYKTDNVKQGNEKEHALMYLNQLEIYSKAVEEIMGIKVESKIIYFFKTNSHIDLNLL